MCLGAVGVGLACGCADLNSRPVLGGRTALPAVTPSREAGGGHGRDVASVRSWDRSNWGSTVVVVPVDGTVHAPTYARGRLYDLEPTRRKGLYPTVESAMELDEPGSRLMRGAEVVAQPFRGLVEVGLMPVRAVVSPPWSRRQSPAGVYKRQPPGGWLTGGAAAPMDDDGDGGEKP